MSKIMDKIGDKLHMGEHKKHEPTPDAAQTPAVDQAVPVAEQGQVQPVRPEAVAAPLKTETAHEGPLDKIKQKLHEGKEKVVGKKDVDVPHKG